MKSQFVRVVLNAERKEDKRILDYLLYSAEPMSKVFKTAMLQFLDRRDNSSDEALIENIRNVIREELQRAQFLSCGAVSQPVALADEEEVVSPLDFLDQLGEIGNI